MGGSVFMRGAIHPARVSALGLSAALALTWLAPAGLVGGSLIPSQAQAEPASVPLPAARPGSAGSAAEAFMPVPRGPAVFNDITGAIPRSPLPETVAALRDGLDALASRNPARAIAVRNAMGEETLDRHILTWAIAMSTQKGIPSYEIARAQQELQGWPGLGTLRASSERALYREDPSPAAVLQAFGGSAPETSEGTLILARALVAKGETRQAAIRLRSLWATKSLDVATETKVLGEFPALLTTVDHKRRMEMLLYRGRFEQAARFSDLGKAQSLYRAWVAMSKKAGNASALIAAIDPSWRDDPAYLFVRIEQLRKQENYEAAAKLLAQLPRDGDRLVDSGEWWVEQRIISRGLADAGNFRGAYRIAAGHVATDAADVVDAEFHAGWYALRGLQDGKTAAAHFERILKASNRPISVSRAYYWLGRAAEKGGPGEASGFYAKAAALSGTFYGQLAGAKLGRKGLNVTYPSPTPQDRSRFESREAVRAIARLEAAGHGWRADGLYLALADSLTSPGELAILSARAEKTRTHSLALQVGKLAFGRGIDVAALAFPLGVIPGSANISGSGKALAYAIARQESAFNPAAVSPANARGLLQILPTTAKLVAGRHGLPYSTERLTTDAGYNATLGAHYLGEQIDDFGGSYILTFIAYNAGPRRVPEWISRYGDPRGKSIDEVVDWIERIPFAETRNYVQRVMENYQVYKSRLGQDADIVEDLRMGRQSS
jgi:soluble lytic murein transglycosylase